MKLLAGGAKALFGGLLSPMYLAAQVTERAATYGADGTLQMGSAPRACLARVDSATERMRGEAGFTITDRAISVLATSIEGDLTTDHEIEIFEGPYAGATFGIANVDRPPGGSYYFCRGARRG